MKLLNLVGKQFGKLTVVKLHHIKGGSYWLCICSCGKQTVNYIGDLRSGHTKSCGCLKIEKAGQQMLKHGMANTRFYATWVKILRRVRNPNCKEFKFYGGRGIRICKEWLKFENFRNDMLGSYKIACNKFRETNVSIERRDTNGNYIPQNCCWIPFLKQCKNRRNTIRVRYGGKDMCLKDFSKIIHKPYSQIYYWYKHNKLKSFFKITFINRPLN